MTICTSVTDVVKCTADINTISELYTQCLQQVTCCVESQKYWMKVIAIATVSTHLGLPSQPAAASLLKANKT
jgi:hypothetical protein